jgi:hypothetical protein
MANVSPRPTIAWALVMWTAGTLIIVGFAGLLNVGVTEEAVRECIADGIIPPEDCEAELGGVEETHTLGLLPVALIIWSAIVLLIGVLFHLSERAARAE